VIGLGQFALDDEPYARGGMGVVWTGRHRVDGARVGVKVLEPRVDTDLVGMLEQEVRAAALLDHPHVVAVWDRGTVDAKAAAESRGRLAPGSPWYAMEFVGGGVLSWRQPWSWAAIRKTLLQLLAGLGHAHARGVLHRDIKPANVLFTTDGRDVKLTDFGMGWRFVANPLGETRVGGTPQYMAPEQFSGDLALQGPWTDLYSVGCLLYALVCGRPPYRGSFQDLRDQHRNGPFPPLQPRTLVPPEVADVLAGLVARPCGERFARAADVVRQLEELPDWGTPGGTAGRTVRDPRGRRGRSASTSFPTLVALEEPPASPSLPTREPPRPTSPPSDWRAVRIAERVMPPGVGLGLFGLRPVPLVGRTAERDALWAALSAAGSAREPRMVVLRGPRGSGKTRLGDWLCEVADESGAAVVLRAACGTGAQREGFAGMVASHYRVPGGLGPEHTWQWLVRALSVEGSVLDDARSLAELVSPPPLTGRSAARTSPAERAGLLARLVRRASGRRSAIVWFDDLDLDPDALILAGRLLQLRDLPVLVLLTVSDDRLQRQRSTGAAFDALLRRPDVAVVDLQPLSADESRALVRGLLPVGPEVVRQVEDRVSGDPLLAVQLVSHWIDRGWLTAGASGFLLHEDALGTGSVSLDQVWEQRLAACVAGDTRREEQLLVAAALGRVVDPAEWEAAARQLDLPGVAAVSKSLVDLGLGRVPVDRPGAFAFSHGLLRDVILGRASPVRLAQVHRACAQVLAGERRGVHLLEAGDLSLAFPLLVDAASVRLRTGEPEAALAVLDLVETRCGPFGEDDPRRAWVEVERAQIFRLGGRFVEAVALAERAARATGAEATIRVKILRELSVLLQYTSVDPRVHGLLDDAFALAHAHQLAEVVPGLWIQRGRALEYQGRFDGAHEAFLTARAHLPPDAPASELGEVLVGLASVVHKLGRPTEALPVALEALQCFREAHLTYHEIWAETLLGEIQRSLGDLAGAEVLYRRAITRYAGLSAEQTALPRTNLAAVLASRGRFEEALDEALVAHQEASASGHANLARMVDLFVAWAAAGAGRWDVFDEVALRVVDLAPSRLVDLDLLHGAEAAAGLALAAGAPERARTCLQVARAQAAALAREADTRRLDAQLAALPAPPDPRG
jgi:serine/threonine protein kinase/tetratricopeptide (TPR) repeat protein